MPNVLIINYIYTVCIIYTMSKGKIRKAIDLTIEKT